MAAHSSQADSCSPLSFYDSASLVNRFTFVFFISPLFLASGRLANDEPERQMIRKTSEQRAVPALCYWVELAEEAIKLGLSAYHAAQGCVYLFTILKLNLKARLWILLYFSLSHFFLNHINESKFYLVLNVALNPAVLDTYQIRFLNKRWPLLSWNSPRDCSRDYI